MQPMWNVIRFRLFLLFRLPAAYFASLRPVHRSLESAEIAIRYSWWTRNPFGSIYFACLAMAAEMSSGILAWNAIRQSEVKINMLLSGLEAEFVRKSTGTIIFKCHDGQLIMKALESLKKPGDKTQVITHSVGIDKAGEVTCRFVITWHFKRK